jgi:TRAP-type C4-dicarboxylate transport system substrate-binding protein
MSEEEQLWNRITELNDEILELYEENMALREVLRETREAWRKKGQPIKDIWERGTKVLKNA